MKLKRLLLGLLAMCGSAMASTIALWDFDESFAMEGVSVPYSTNGAFVVSATDKSGNGNDLSLWTDGSAGKEMRSTTNSYFGDWSIKAADSGAWQDLRMVNNTVPGGVDLRTITPTALTVEAVFTVEALNWDVLVCRDGNITDAPSFRLLLNSSGTPQVLWRNTAGVQTELTGPAPLAVDATKWRHLAATADGGNLKLYLDGQLIASGTMINDGLELDPGTGTGADQGHTWTGGDWAVGRGMWQGNKSDGFPGKIDAVAISDETLVPADFVLQFPVTAGPVVPEDGESTTNRTISATMNSFGLTIATLKLYVDGNLVETSSVDPENTVATITYDGSAIPAGGHTGMVVATTTDSQTFTNQWAFSFIDEVPDPAPYASELYNINFAGRTSSNATVPDGTVVKAPALTTIDRWNNLIAPTANGWDSWTPASPITINTAYGTNTIGLTWTGRANDWSNGGWGYAGLFNGYLGSRGFDGTMIISGLDADASYDVYAYFTWGWNANESTFTITEGTTPLTRKKFTPVQANAASYSNIAEGQNYVIIADVVPSAGGGIQIRSQSGDGGWSGMQIVKRSDVPVDFMVPFIEGDFLPVDGARFTGGVVDLSGTLYDRDAQVDEMYLYLDGGLVDSQTGLFGGETNATVGYAASSLSLGLHTAKVTAVGYGIADSLTYTYTNEWSFYIGVEGFGLHITGTNAPVAGADDIAQFQVPGADWDNIGGFVNGANITGSGQNDASTYVAGDRNTQGQIFTTGSTAAGYEFTSVWVKHVAYTNFLDNGTWASLNPGNAVTIRIVDPAQTNTAGFVVYSEVLTVVSNSIVSSGDSGTGNWLKFSLSVPVALDANKQYGFDLTSYGPWFELAGMGTNDWYGGGDAYSTASKEALNLGTVHSAADRTFLIELNPTGATMVPNIRSIVVSGGSAMLTWDSQTGGSYSVMSKSSLTSGSWTEVTTVPGAGATTSVSVPAGSAQGFFKIIGN